MKKIIILVVIIIIVVWGFSLREEASDEMVSDTSMESMMSDVEYLISGTLKDVTNGEVVRGVQTSPNTSGSVKAGLDNGKYVLSAEFEYLPDPQGDDFYEGWVVRKGELSVISTGKLEKEDGMSYTNVFMSDENLLDHDFYVLTLEPNDGDPAPADHILDGELK